MHEEFEGIQFGSRSRTEDRDDHDGTCHENQNGNNNEILKNMMIQDRNEEAETRRGRKDKRRSLSTKKTSSAGRLLSCLGFDDKCRQS